METENENVRVSSPEDISIHLYKAICVGNANIYSCFLQVLSCIRLNEEDTSSASRIFIKILIQELSEYMGLPNLNERLKDP